jgi:arginine exporter protein ArgO
MLVKFQEKLPTPTFHVKKKEEEIINFSFITKLVEIFQHHQRMELTFLNPHVILEFVSSTLIFWTDLSS